MIKGMDVSVWNGKGNWDIARSKGVEFAFIRLGSIDNFSGSCYLDTLLQDHLSEAKRTNTPFGYFFYFRPKFSASLQTNFIIQNLATLPKANMEFAIDAEEIGSSIAVNTQFYKDVQIQLKNVGYNSLIYTRQTFWDTYVNSDPLWPTLKLWAARYNESLSSPWSDGKYIFRDWKVWKFWQYTASDINTYSVEYGFPGYPTGSTGLELDYYNGTLDDFKKEYNVTNSLEARVTILEKQVSELKTIVDYHTGLFNGIKDVLNK